MRSLVAVICPLLVVLSCGCGEKKKPDPSKPFDYHFYFDTDQVAVHSELQYNGTTVGRVKRLANWKPGDVRSHGSVKLPMSWKQDANKSFALFAMTPCGPSRTKVEILGKPTSTIQFKTPKVMSRTTKLLHPWSGVVQIGEATLRADGSEWPVSDLDCAKSHQILVDGKPEGTLDVTPEMSEYVFIAESEKACYDYTIATYGRNGGVNNVVKLRGKRAYALPGKVNRFLQKVNTQYRVSKTTASVGMVVRYLTKVDCKKSK